jgi:hypothetical protein
MAAPLACFENSAMTFNLDLQIRKNWEAERAILFTNHPVQC